MNSIPALLLSATAVAAPAVHDWENPAVNSINRLPPRTYAMPLAAEADALTDDLEPATPYALSLDGNWKFSWTGDPALRPADFWRTDFDDSSWFEIDVPSCVETRGFGTPGYTNVRYPFKLDWPRIRDRQSGRADYNPVSSYRRTFTVPESWKGRRVILRFDGVYSAYYVWVNGKKVGYAEDSKLPSEFDITDSLIAARPESAPYQTENVLAVEVYRWCDGSYLEDQDMNRFSGIFRDVTLWSMPKDGIWDFAVRTTPDGGYERWKIEVEGVGVEGACVSLYDADRQKVCDLHPTTAPNTYTSTLAARAWSAEDPYLYTLVLRKGDDIRMKRIGFKDIRVSGHTLLVNGRRIKFKGVNRHECHPENGRTVTVADMVRDIELMKRYNLDTVRTSHYPNHHSWYDLCDRYGLYVCAEANVEGHEPRYSEKGLGRFEAWKPAIVERNVRQVLNYRNHPCVTLWSLGNETGHGVCFEEAARQVRAIDASRPLHWERGDEIADVDSRMYPSVEWVEERGRLGDGPADGRTIGDRHEKDVMSLQYAGKPFWMCEYAHAMGNAMGNFREYWDVFYRYESLTGGCIWDWADQALWKPTGEVGADGRPERFLAFGGDWDEQPNDGPFNCNGVVDAERHVTAKLVEVGHVLRNLVVRRRGEGFELENRFGFTSADRFAGAWELLEDGAVVRRGAFDVPAVPPLSTGALSLPEVKVSSAAREALLNVSFSLKEATRWAPKGWIVARDQIALVSRGLPPAEVVRGTDVRMTETDEAVTVEAGGTRAVFSRRTGTLAELVMDGVTVLKDPASGVVAGPRLTCLRAFVDNDKWLEGATETQDDAFVASGLTQLSHHARPLVVKDGTVETSVEVTGSRSAGFTHAAVWTFAADGAISVANEVVPHGTMPKALPRLGLSLRLDRALEQVRYYGRGPRENYVDRCSGSFLGVWSSTVDGLGEFYVRPQDNGYRGDVRWIEFADTAGRGVRFSASEPLFVQALHQSCDDLQNARHRKGERRRRASVPRRPDVYLNLDIRQLGLGGASCGPRPMDRYVFPIRPERWTLRIAPRGILDR